MNSSYGRRVAIAVLRCRTCGLLRGSRAVLHYVRPMSIELVEVGPRDGLQNETRTLDWAVRVEAVERLLAAGVRRVEAGSFVRADVVPQMADAEKVFGRVSRTAGASLSALVLNRRGLDAALAAGADEVNVVVPCTETLAQRNQNRSVGALLELAEAVVAAAREQQALATLTVAVAFGCPYEGEVAPERVVPVVQRAHAAGFDEIVFADTIGVGVPRQVEALARLAREHAPKAALRFHFHNTRNTGYANATAAVAAGDGARRGGRWIRWMRVRPRQQRQHRHGRAAVPARARRRLRDARPRGPRRDRDVGGREARSAHAQQPAARARLSAGRREHRALRGPSRRSGRSGVPLPRTRLPG